MKLLTLLKDLPSHTLTGSPQVKISHLECDSRRILPGSCYIALKGTRADGHEFIPEAIRRGACAVVAEMPCTQEAREAVIKSTPKRLKALFFFIFYWSFLIESGQDQPGRSIY